MFFYIEGVIITFERYTYTESKYEKTTDKVFSDIKKTTTKKPDARSRNITLELNDFQPTGSTLKLNESKFL